MKPVDAVFAFLGILLITLIIINIVADGRESKLAEAERLETLQTCIEFDNPVEWCIEHFG